MHRHIKFSLQLITALFCFYTFLLPLTVYAVSGCCKTNNQQGGFVNYRDVDHDCSINSPLEIFEPNKHVGPDGKSCVADQTGSSGSWEEDEPSSPIATPKLSVRVPNLTLSPSTCDKTSCTAPWLAEYIDGIYKYGILALSIIAVVVIMFAGVLWLTAAGNSEQVGQAKKWIGGGLAGLLLIYSPYILLNLINSNLTKLNFITVKYIEGVKLDTEEPIVGGFEDKREAQLDRDEKKDILLAGNIDSSQEYRAAGNPFAFLSISKAQAACSFIIAGSNTGANLETSIFKKNNVPAIYCPHTGGESAIAAIVASIQDAGSGDKGIITYRYGGKGGYKKYVDGTAPGDTKDHSCNQDEECADQLKGKENERSNCKYCCPAGTACLDCSAFVNHVLSCAGLPIIDSGSGTMTACGEKTTEADVDVNNRTANGIPLVPGDLLTLKGHVIIYLGNGQTAESTPGNDDEGRRPGKGLVVRNLNSRKYLAVIRSSKALSSSNSTCSITDQSCEKNKDCCGSNICQNGNFGNRGGSCKACIADWQWNCIDDNDCCNKAQGFKCLKQSNGHYKCDRPA